MKTHLLVYAFLALTFTTSMSAQRPPGGGGGSGGKTPGRGTVSIPVGPRLGIPDSNVGTIFLLGKVVVDDGTPLTEPATIQTVCKGQKRTEAHTDAHGGFSFEFGNRISSAIAGIADADTSLSDPGVSRSNQRDQGDWRDCELQAVLAGFSSEVIQLNSRISSFFGSNDIGRVSLHRLSHIEGFTISATTALAPKDARKAFEKGQEQEKKEKWDDAQRSFEKAVEVYPKFAVAWFELGRVQAQKNDPAGARSSFNQALAADPKYASPYEGLARLAEQAGQWPEVVDVTSKLLALNPVNFPDAWFFNAVGNYYLKNFEAAEKSARQGIKVDEGHTLPKLEYLLGMILMQKHDYAEAQEHMQQYLHLATKPADVDEAQKRLAELAKLSAAASAPTVGEKK
jgi:tetratricopeptide (TPR) repeat protein